MPIRDQNEEESPNDKSSSSGSSRLSSVNSSRFPRDSSPSDSEKSKCLSHLHSHLNNLKDDFGLCSNYLEHSSRKIILLRHKNTALRLINRDLKNRLIEVYMDLHKTPLPDYVSSFINDFLSLSIGDILGGSTGYNRFGPSRETSVTSSGITDNEFDEKPIQVQSDRTSLPKSISIRSNAYLKMNQSYNPSASDTTAPPSSNKNVNRLTFVAPRVKFPAEKKEVDPLELDVYNQGMSKTELCNKWVEEGVCPYGDYCQFAHGLKELRPVIRHPRYKTEACKMILNGGSCSYGHRCHFRHALSDQEIHTGTTHS
ncbi:hypothetical protein MKX03_002004 [Papaver bracteatum]|nr:hypothetical protein MKX03_002004 [Papaver bracteatum]